MATNKVTSIGDSIEIPMEAYNVAQSFLALPNALLGGTEAMRAAGKLYLPQEEGESELKYEARLARTTLLEVYGRTIEKLVGEMFRVPVNITDDVDEEIKEWLDDIDRRGRNLTAFCVDLMEAGVHEGIVHLLVDYPRSPGATVEAHKKAGARPYWIVVRGSRLIGWRFTETNAGPKLTQARILEKHQVDDGLYGEKTVDRVRLLEPGKWAVYEEGDVGWTLARYDDDGTPMQGTTNLDYIPLFTIRCGRATGEMTAKPPLLPLAHLNHQHWQSSSDQRNILHYARLVTWFGRMIQEDDDGRVLIGANRMVRSDSPNGDLKVVEHSGAAISAGRQDLEDLKTEMSMFGLSLMIGKTGGITATEKAIDKGENDSSLARWVRSLNSALWKALEATCKYVGKEPSGELNANDDFSGILRSQDPQTIIQAYEAGLITREVAIEELKVRGLITQEIDLVELVRQLEEDQKRSNPEMDVLKGAFGGLKSIQDGQGTPPLNQDPQAGQAGWNMQ